MEKVEYNDFELIPIKDIIIEDNARKKFDETALKELADSIVQVGIINPITVSIDDGKYKLVAGERRIKASIMAGMKRIPSTIVKGSSSQLKEIQLIENCQRKDINPIEELEAFMGLISEGVEPSVIAEKIGKSKTYIHARLNLIKLTDTAKNMLFNESINLQHCKILVVMDESLQEKALESLTYTDGMSVLKMLPPKEFYNFFIKNQTKQLSLAKFATDDKTLLKSAIACVSCKNNSVVNELLFGGISKESICNNPKCFDEKTEAAISNTIKAYISEGIEVKEVSQYYSEVYPTVYEFTKIPDDVVKTEGFKVEIVVMVVEGSDLLGTHYPVFSESDLKAITKASEISKGPNPLKPDKKVEKAVKRYSELVVSEISEKYIQQNDLFTPGIHLLAIWKLFSYLSNEEKKSFLSAIIGAKINSDVGYKDFKKTFFDNSGLIEENIEQAFAVVNLLGMDSTMVYDDAPTSIIIRKLAEESGVDIQKCKDQIEKESSINLSKV